MYERELVDSLYFALPTHAAAKAAARARRVEAFTERMFAQEHPRWCLPS